MTEEEGIYTSGGAYSYLNLLLYLIEKYAGREVAIMTAKTYMIDMDKNSQSPFIMFQGQKSHDDNVVKKSSILLNIIFRIELPQIILLLSLRWEEEVWKDGLKKQPAIQSQSIFRE